MPYAIYHMPLKRLIIIIINVVIIIIMLMTSICNVSYNYLWWQARLYYINKTVSDFSYVDFKYLPKSPNFISYLRLKRNFIAVLTTYGRVLRGVRGDVLERPVHVLMLCQLSRERRRLLAAHPQDAVVRRQHRPVHQ